MKLIFALLLGLFLCGTHSKAKYNKRVIGGEIAPPDKYRWAVSIIGNIDERKSVGVCGASILKTEGDISWLVTAAHCFFLNIKGKVYNLTDPKHWHARMGLTKVDFLYKKHGLGYKIRNKLKSFFHKAYRRLFEHKETSVTTGDLHMKKLFIHPHYVPSRLENDIALMKLEDPLPVQQLIGVNTIDFPHLSANEKWPEVGSTCATVGWGCTEAGGSPNTIAKLALLKIWNNRKCEIEYRWQIGLNPVHEFCAGYSNKNHGICPGDSGSGLACKYKGNWTLAGVVSAAHRKRPGDFPGIFTRVSAFKDWIFDTIKKN